MQGRSRRSWDSQILHGIISRASGGVETRSDPEEKPPGSRVFGILVQTGLNWDDGISPTGNGLGRLGMREWTWNGKGNDEVGKEKLRVGLVGKSHGIPPPGMRLWERPEGTGSIRESPLFQGMPPQSRLFPMAWNSLCGIGGGGCKGSDPDSAGDGTNPGGPGHPECAWERS